MSTPLEISVAIHYYGHADQFPGQNFPEIVNTLNKFVEMELLTKTYVNNMPYYEKTDGLVVYVNRLKEIPFPHKETHWEFI